MDFLEEQNNNGFPPSPPPPRPPGFPPSPPPPPNRGGFGNGGSAGMQPNIGGLGGGQLEVNASGIKFDFNLAKKIPYKKLFELYLNNKIAILTTLLMFVIFMIVGLRISGIIGTFIFGIGGLLPIFNDNFIAGIFIGVFLIIYFLVLDSLFVKLKEKNLNLTLGIYTLLFVYGFVISYSGYDIFVIYYIIIVTFLVIFYINYIEDLRIIKVTNGNIDNEKEKEKLLTQGLDDRKVILDVGKNNDIEQVNDLKQYFNTKMFGDEDEDKKKSNEIENIIMKRKKSLLELIEEEEADYSFIDIKKHKILILKFNGEYQLKDSGIIERDVLDEVRLEEFYINNDQLLNSKKKKSDGKVEKEGIKKREELKEKNDDEKIIKDEKTIKNKENNKKNDEKNDNEISISDIIGDGEEFGLEELLK